MEEIEELKKKLQCQKCQTPYSEEREGLVSKSCYHHICNNCLVAFRCAVCDRSTEHIEIPFLTDMLTTLKNYESFVLTTQNKYDDLKNEEEQREMTLKNHHKCSECETSDSEQNLQLCETCHELKFKGHEDVKNHALCAVCAIKKHMRQGHKTVDFFPYLSAYNFSSQLPKIGSKSEEHKSAQDLLNNTFTSFNTVSANVSKNYNVLTDMARRSKSTKQQVEIFEKMEMFIEKSKSIHGEADSDMKNHTTKLEETLAEIKEWYESRIENCVDESEIIKLPNSEDSEKNDTGIDA